MTVPRTSSRPGRLVPVALGLGVAVLTLAGCSAGSSTSSASLADGSGVGRQAQGAGAPAVAAPAKADAGTAATSPLAGIDTTGWQIVVRADLTVRVDDVGRGTARVAEIAARQQAVIASQTSSSGGGPVPVAVPVPGCSSDPCPTSSTPDGYASSTTTLRVDPSRADALVRELSALGAVVSSSRSSDDVTADVADVDARVANAQASLARIRALMSRAVAIGDVVALEGELSRRQGDLEALQARQRTLADQTAQATVVVTLVDQGAAVAQDAATGFVPGLRHGWDAFTSALTVAMTVLGAVLPFLLVLVPAALAVRWGLRRTRRPDVDPAPDASPAAGAAG